MCSPRVSLIWQGLPGRWWPRLQQRAGSLAGSWFPGHWSECVRAPLSRFRRPRQRWFCGPVTWRGGGCVDDDLLGEHAFRIFRCSFTPFAQSALSATRTLPGQCAMWWCDLRRCDESESRELMRIRQRCARASAHCRSLLSLHMKPPPPPHHRLLPELNHGAEGVVPRQNNRVIGKPSTKDNRGTRRLCNGPYIDCTAMQYQGGGKHEPSTRSRQEKKTQRRDKEWQAADHI